MSLAPYIECEENEIHPACVVQYPRVKDRTSGGVILDLANGSWIMREGDVTDDGRVRLVVSHDKSYQTFRLDMDASGHWSIDGTEHRVVGSRIPNALAAKNVEPLIARARTLLAQRPFVPDDITQALDTKAPVAKLFYPRIGKDGAKEVSDSTLYWVLYDLDAALVAAIDLVRHSL